MRYVYSKVKVIVEIQQSVPSSVDRMRMSYTSVAH